MCFGLEEKAGRLKLSFFCCPHQSCSTVHTAVVHISFPGQQKAYPWRQKNNMLRNINLVWFDPQALCSRVIAGGSMVSIASLISTWGHQNDINANTSKPIFSLTSACQPLVHTSVMSSCAASKQWRTLQWPPPAADINAVAFCCVSSALRKSRLHRLGMAYSRLWVGTSDHVFRKQFNL